MPNPGAFQGSWKEFLLGEKKDFTRGVLTSSVSEALAVIQHQYFKQYLIDLPHDEEPSTEHLVAIDDNAADPEIEQPDEAMMDAAEYQLVVARMAERQKNIKKRKAVSVVFMLWQGCMWLTNKIHQQIKQWFIYQYMKDHDADPRDWHTYSP